MDHEYEAAIRKADQDAFRTMLPFFLLVLIVPIGLFILL